MTETLPRKLSSLFRRITILQLVAFFVVGIFTAGTHELAARGIAEELSKNLRRLIGLGDTREAMLIAHEATTTQFDEIRYDAVRTENSFVEPFQAHENDAFDDVFKRKLKYDLHYDTIGKEKIGTVTFKYSIFKNTLPLFLIFITFIIISQCIFKSFKIVLIKATENDVIAKRDAAIAKMTQMLSHDVRRPFTTVQSVLKCVLASKTIEEAKKVAQNVQPLLSLSTQTVEGALCDVLELGSRTKPEVDSISPKTLIEMALNQFFCFQTNTNVRFSYDFKNRHCIEIDVRRVLRVFANLINNAIEATGGKSEFSFCVNEIIQNRKNFTEFKFRNMGSSIDQTDQERIFDDFFTKGKRSGTGLGLAIVQKIVTDHGGTVFCNSSVEESWVEFVLTFPTSNKIDSVSVQLPSTSKDVETHWQAFTQNEARKTQESPVIQIEDKLTESCLLAQKKCRILVIDDEKIYLKSIEALLVNSPDLAKNIEFFYADCAKEAISMARIHEPHLIICDLFLGPLSLRGIEIIEELRVIGSNAVICIYSNTSNKKDVDSAMSAGADFFIPKPMTYEQLIEAAMSAAKKLNYESHNLPEFSVIDDEMTYRYLWTTFVKDAKVNVFTTPEEFWEHVEKCPSFLKSQKLIVTDYHFEKKSNENGRTFAKAIRKQCNQIVILSSNLGTNKEKWHSEFNAVIKKEPISFEQLRSLIA